MVQVVFIPSELKLIMKGHANYSQEGTDPVCTSASILFCTLAQSLTDSMEMMKKPIRIKAAWGNSELSCTPKLKYKANIIRSYWTILEGLRMLQKDFPQNISITIK